MILDSADSPHQWLLMLVTEFMDQVVVRHFSLKLPLLQVFPQVFCDWQGEHLALVACFGVASILPIIFLAYCLWIMCQYPKRLHNGDSKFMRLGRGLRWQVQVTGWNVGSSSWLCVCCLWNRSVFSLDVFFVAVSVENLAASRSSPKPRSCAFLALRLRPGQELFSLFLLFRNALLGIFGAWKKATHFLEPEDSIAGEMCKPRMHIRLLFWEQILWIFGADSAWWMVSLIDLKMMRSPAIVEVACAVSSVPDFQRPCGKHVTFADGKLGRHSSATTLESKRVEFHWILPLFTDSDRFSSFLFYFWKTILYTQRISRYTVYVCMSVLNQDALSAMLPPLAWFLAFS